MHPTTLQTTRILRVPASRNAEFQTAVFYVFAAILLFAALRVITARNPVHAVLFLVLAFATAAGLWMLLEAEFLAIALILVYIGAVMVLFLFVVMMLDINIDRLREGYWDYLVPGLAVALIMVTEMAVVLGGRRFGLLDTPVPAARPPSYSNTEELGRVLYTALRLPLRDRGGHPAGGHRRGDRADAAAPARFQVPGSGRQVRRAQAGPDPDRDDAVGEAVT